MASIALALCLSAMVLAQDESRVTPMDRQTAKERSLEALSASGFAVDSMRDEVERAWSSEPSTLAAVARSLALCHDPARSAIESPTPSRHQAWSEPPLVRDPAIDPFLRTNAAVYLAQKLVQAEYLDEALAMLANASTNESVDPAAHQFLLALCHYHLGHRSEALDAIAEFQRVDNPPERYMATVQLMLLSLQQSKPDSLDGIAAEMRDVRRRLDLGRTDKQVQGVEDMVLKKLDDMIEELEKQRKEQEQQSDQLQPNAPAPDSRPLGGEGEGKADAKKFTDHRGWGNLPAKEREKALQEIGRDLPGHYRDAVEQYFRKLAELPVRKEP